MGNKYIVILLFTLCLYGCKEDTVLTNQMVREKIITGVKLAETGELGKAEITFLSAVNELPVDLTKPSLVAKIKLYESAAICAFIRGDIQSFQAIMDKANALFLRRQKQNDLFTDETEAFLFAIYYFGINKPGKAKDVIQNSPLKDKDKLLKFLPLTPGK